MASLGLGLWVGADPMPERRRWVAVVVAYVAASLFTLLFMQEPTLRASGLGGALAVLFLIAQPA